MSFHGGVLGVIVAIVWFCRRNGIPLLGFGDRVAVCVPIGLGFGRIANFINGELWGRPAPDWLPWAMIFPNAGPDAAPSEPALPGAAGRLGAVPGACSRCPAGERCGRGSAC